MRIITGVIFLIFLSGCRPDEKDDIRILFTGDILLSRNVAKEIGFKKINPWFNLMSEFKQADIVAGNLEGAVGTTADIKNSVNIIFDIPAKSLTLLREAGFSVITVQNNHINDLGISNRDTTITELKKAGLVPVSISNSPWFINIKNTTISFVTVSLIKDRLGLRDSIPLIQVQQKLRLARSLSDFVIVSIHWGNELLDWPSKSQRTAAEWIVENGADLIIGHHPHVIQNAEIINGKPVFFSLGNHLFDQKYNDSKKGLIVECVIKNGKACYSGILTKTMKNSFFPETEKKISFGFDKIRIEPNGKFYDYTILPTSVLEGTEGKTILTGYLNGKKKWTTQPISLLSCSEARFDEKNKYLFTLEEHFSTLDNETAPRPYVYSITETGLQALWRGSALSRPLIDATLTEDKKYLFALHRKDPFINLNPGNYETVTEIYKWNGFGFSGLKDSSAAEFASRYYKPHNSKN